MAKMGLDPNGEFNKSVLEAMKEPPTYLEPEKLAIDLNRVALTSSKTASKMKNWAEANGWKSR